MADLLCEGAGVPFSYRKSGADESLIIKESVRLTTIDESLYD
jgi:hypothetical protein